LTRQGLCPPHAVGLSSAKIFVGQKSMQMPQPLHKVSSTVSLMYREILHSSSSHVYVPTRR
jgi:hypothetical protein